MGRSSNSERTQRLNTAWALLKEHKSLSRAAKALTSVYGISRRQAYRYLRKAEGMEEPIPIPDTKIAFTVKLSQDLIQTLRRYATSTDKTLSEIVTEALQALLRNGRGRG